MKNEKEELRKLRQILASNAVPKIQFSRRKACIYALEQEAGMMDILPRRPWTEKLLAQIEYISFWVWAVQAVVLMAGIYISLRNMDDLVSQSMLSFVSPCLVLVLMAEILRSFGHNVWEMEAACRYDLRQVMAMRMCIVGGMDVAILLILFGVFSAMGGSILTYLLFVVLPFFITASICLIELKCMPGRCSDFILAATGIGVSIPLMWFMNLIQNWILQNSGFWENTFLTGTVGMIVTIGAAAVFLIAAVGICRTAKNLGEERKERWNLG